MRCALYFGSFNPLHIGHAAIARYVLQNCNAESLRLVLTPVNPFKVNDPALTDVNARLAALQRSVDRFNREYADSCKDNYCKENNSKENNSKENNCKEKESNNMDTAANCRDKKLEISTVEFDLPQPNYTYNTLEHLKRLEPGNTFIIIMGADNLAAIEKWYRGLEILQQYEVWVYPREGFDTRALCQKYGATYLDAPLMNVSSTMIREGLAQGHDMSQLMY